MEALASPLSHMTYIECLSPLMLMKLATAMSQG